MVNARAFSFTDDSTNVELPHVQSTLGTKTAAQGSIPGPHSMETAVLLFKLRLVQSSWYQTLFQSSREPLQDAPKYISERRREMREWSELIPDELSRSIRELFDLELLYSYIYCLAPSCRISKASEFDESLIIEYSIAYMQKLALIVKSPDTAAFYTYHDALRVYFIGTQFVMVLIPYKQLLLHSVEGSTYGGRAAEPLPLFLSTKEMVEDCIRCIHQIVETLKSYGVKWGDAQALCMNIEAQSSMLLAVLCQLQQIM